MKKLVPLLIALLGLALVIAAFVVWFEPPKEGGVFSTAGSIILFLSGLGTSIKGWMDVFKKDVPATNTQNQTQDQSQTQSQVIHVHNYPPDYQSPVNNHQFLKNTLPQQPYFFGRAKELATIADAISPDSRTWGALIDGPGGIGKTALAIKAAHDAPAELFERKIFITAKVRDLTAEGEKPLTDFTRPTYLAMLDELGKELGETGLEKLAPDERPNELRLALAGKKALIVFDNLETLPEEERTRLFQFLSRLPEGNKAIVTSRRRSDVDARIVRLDRLSHDEAMQLVKELAKKYPRLGRATVEEHEQLYAITQGNPLFIRWIAGQLGREGSQLRTISEAVAFIDKAPKNNDPLEYIFGDLLETFKEDQTKVLAALTHFDKPAQSKWIAQMTDLPEKSAETALEDLTDRSILIADFESRTFYLPPLTAKFIKTRRPEAVTQTGDALTNRAYALAMQYGGKDYEKFPMLDAEWDFISAALPRLLTGDNNRLQTLCDQLDRFLDFTGRWDDWLWLSEQAEACATSVNNKVDAIWRANQGGKIYSLRNQPLKAQTCKIRIAEYLGDDKSLMYSFLHKLILFDEDIRSYFKIDFEGLLESESFNQLKSVAPDLFLNEDEFLYSIGYYKQKNKNRTSAERNYREALRIAKKIKDDEGTAIYTGNLSELALDREQWAEAESLARKALALAEKVGRQELIANDSHVLAKALLKQNKNLDEALSMSSHAVEIYTRLRHPNLQSAQELLAEIEEAQKK
ncbi:MAG: ATP-binding protein [Anaerolineae bacterium]|nr:ATP-binding protein [Anaerolineae bacterium]